MSIAVQLAADIHDSSCSSIDSEQTNKSRSRPLVKGDLMSFTPSSVFAHLCRFNWGMAERIRSVC
jgi:hypothetical protein